MKSEEKVAQECERLARLLCAKNAAYGNSVGNAPILLPDMDKNSAIFVRMSDKIARLKSLINGSQDNGESLSDTVRDLAGYCIMYLIVNQTGEES
ncbi:MAG: nucleotide modification associated domain-containing protein [Planctomycetia bacterium]|nr:nucleotide modification associated domain-containing protein [Planctomycetia bacterium]